MIGKRQGGLVLKALATGLALAALSPQKASAQASAPVVQIQIPAESDFRSVLDRHGKFYMHETYGEVWVPVSLPLGWRPYSECKWSFHQTYGWYYDDRSEWGRIVHHYGRWAHDERVGWMWVPGAEWSPGWVVWRTSNAYVGWAPMPPDADVARISVEAFNSDKHWMFQEEARFKGGCAATPEIAAADATRGILRETRIVTQTRFVGGVFVYVLPVQPVQVVDFSVGTVFPWSAQFIGGIFANWNRMWNDVSGQSAILSAALNQCTIDQPAQKLNLPVTPPAPPPQRRTDTPPPAPPPTRVGVSPVPPVGPPPVAVPPFVPPPVVSPPIVTPPPVVTPPVAPFPPVVVFPPRPPRVDPPGDHRPPGGKPPTPPSDGGGKPPIGPGGVKPPIGTGGVKDPGPPVIGPGGRPPRGPIVGTVPPKVIGLPPKTTTPPPVILRGTPRPIDRPAIVNRTPRLVDRPPPVLRGTPRLGPPVHSPRVLGGQRFNNPGLVSRPPVQRFQAPPRLGGGGGGGFAPRAFSAPRSGGFGGFNRGGGGGFRLR